jgi:uncharacterized protein YndB with AHSA1/START domain
MKNREAYVPGPAMNAQIEKSGDKWALVLVRDLRHPPELVWQALTDPAHLAAWSPFDPDRNMSTVGPVKLATVGTPHVAESTITRAEKPRLLEYGWGGNELRWELEPLGQGTRLKLWHNIDRNFISWGAAGWHICFDVLDRFLAGDPIERIAGPETMKLEGWQRLLKEYTAQLQTEAER